VLRAMSQNTISVIEETLDITLPNERVRVLCAQPFISFRDPIQEPFPLSTECESRLFTGLDRVLDAARNFSPQFIAFPEFSIPGLRAVECIIDTMRQDSIASSTILLGGLTSLTVQEFASFADFENVDVNIADRNAPVHMPGDAWVNTSVVIAKRTDGSLSMWLQPKISPSWPESQSTHQGMFKGRALHLFRCAFEDGLPCHFFTALCYDWIGRESGTTVPKLLLQHFNDACVGKGSPQYVNWVFVLQHNRKPNDDTFLSATRDFLTDPDFAFVNRDDAAVIMACTASTPTPGGNGEYGCSSVIFNPRAPFDTAACPSTFTTKGAHIRNSQALRTCKDVVFREMGECFHVFDMRNPRRVREDSTDRTLPIEVANVFSFTGETVDPRLPDGPVPAVMKWLLDELDRVAALATQCLHGCSLESDIAQSQMRIASGHRTLTSQTAAERIHRSKASAIRIKPSDDPASLVDYWGQEERDGLEHVVHCLSIIGSVENIGVSSTLFHGRHELAGVEIAAIRGERHTDCFEAFDKWSARTHSPMLLISRDRQNTEPMQRELDFFADPGRASGIKITDAQTLLTKARRCTRAELGTFTAELFDVSDRRII
jgi:hypothetical protein